MDGHDLLSALHGTTEFESVGDAPAEEKPVRSRRVPPDLSGCITNVVAGNRQMPILKAMSTTACERDCFYCPFRAGRTSMKRVRFTPDELASGFMALYRAGAVEGLFLSSGIIRGGVTSQDTILDTGAILREKYGFRGYLHLKLMPGAERDQVREAMRLANRVSINLEAPNPHRLERIAPGKRFDEELLTPLRWVEEFRRDPDANLRASSTTVTSSPTITTKIAHVLSGDSSSRPVVVPTGPSVPEMKVINPALVRPMNRMKKPIPTLIACFSGIGTTSITYLRTPVITSSVIRMPSATTTPIASGKESPMLPTSVNATIALMPSPGAIATAMLA